MAEALAFTAGGVELCVPVSDVEGAISLEKAALYPLPFTSDDRIMGLFRHRGEVYPLEHVQGLISSDELPGTITVLLLRARSGLFGLPIDSIGAASIEDAPGEAVSADDIHGGRFSAR